MNLKDFENINLPEIPKVAQGYISSFLNPHLREQMDSENAQRSADNSEDIFYETTYLREELSKLNKEVSDLRKELAVERKKI